MEVECSFFGFMVPDTFNFPYAFLTMRNFYVFVFVSAIEAIYRVFYFFSLQEHYVIEMFWEVLKSFSLENQKKFLK